MGKSSAFLLGLCIVAITIALSYVVIVPAFDNPGDERHYDPIQASMVQTTYACPTCPPCQTYAPCGVCPGVVCDCEEDDMVPDINIFIEPSAPSRHQQKSSSTGTQTDPFGHHPHKHHDSSSSGTQTDPLGPHVPVVPHGPFNETAFKAYCAYGGGANAFTS